MQWVVLSRAVYRTDWTDNRNSSSLQLNMHTIVAVTAICCTIANSLQLNVHTIVAVTATCCTIANSLQLNMHTIVAVTATCWLMVCPAATTTTIAKIFRLKGLTMIAAFSLKYFLVVQQIYINTNFPDLIYLWRCCTKRRKKYYSVQLQTLIFNIYM